MANLNVDSVAAFLRGGELSKVQQLQTEFVKRLTKLKVAVGGRSYRGAVKTSQLNERAVLDWVANVQPKSNDLKVLQRLERTAAKRLG